MLLCCVLFIPLTSFFPLNIKAVNTLTALLILWTFMGSGDPLIPYSSCRLHIVVKMLLVYQPLIRNTCAFVVCKQRSCEYNAAAVVARIGFISEMTHWGMLMFLEYKHIFFTLSLKLQPAHYFMNASLLYVVYFSMNINAFFFFRAHIVTNQVGIFFNMRYIANSEIL